MITDEQFAELQARVAKLEESKRIEEQTWIQVKVEASKGKTKWEGHGIGRTEAEAVKVAEAPDGFKIDTQTSLGEIDPEDFELFWTSKHLDEGREERLANKPGN